MIGMLILPILAVSALAAGVTGLGLGASAAFAVLRSFVFMLAPGSLCICFMVWRGSGTRTNILLLVPLCSLSPIFSDLILSSKTPYSATGTFVALCVLLAFLLTRRTIQRSSRAYVVPANQFGSVWGAGR
jgi:hypothetical protein